MAAIAPTFTSSVFAEDAVLYFSDCSDLIWYFNFSLNKKKSKVPRAYKIQATHYNLSNVLSTFSCFLKAYSWGLRIVFKQYEVYLEHQIGD